MTNHNPIPPPVKGPLLSVPMVRPPMNSQNAPGPLATKPLTFWQCAQIAAAILIVFGALYAFGRPEPDPVIDQSMADIETINKLRNERREIEYLYEYERSRRMAIEAELARVKK